MTSDRVERNDPPGLIGRIFAPDDRRALAKLLIGVAIIASLALVTAGVAGLAIRVFMGATGLWD